MDCLAFMYCMNFIVVTVGVRDQLNLTSHSRFVVPGFPKYVLDLRINSSYDAIVNVSCIFTK